jgi:hypothetical protein
VEEWITDYALVIDDLIVEMTYETHPSLKGQTLTYGIHQNPKGQTLAVRVRGVISVNLKRLNSRNDPKGYGWGHSGLGRLVSCLGNRNPFPFNQPAVGFFYTIPVFLPIK